VVEHLRGVPGVETVALTVWPLMSGESCAGFISIGGAPPSEVLSDLLSVSPGWFNAMRIPLIDGRDFRAGDTSPAVAIVNVAFAKLAPGTTCACPSGRRPIFRFAARAPKAHSCL
jgi:hypothetical protein